MEWTGPVFCFWVFFFHIVFQEILENISNDHPPPLEGQGEGQDSFPPTTQLGLGDRNLKSGSAALKRLGNLWD